MIGRQPSSCFFIFVLFALMAAPFAVGQADKYGQWNTLPQTMPINPVHTALLNNGKVVIVSGSGNIDTNNVYSAGLWDPATGNTTTQIIGWDMFCNGMVQLGDGRILINGGTQNYNPFYGLAKSAIYDPATDTFTDTNSTAHGRWYPTLTMLGDGRVMTFSGFMENGNTNNTVEIYTFGTGWSQQYTSPWNPPLYPRMHLLPNGKVFYSGPTPTSSLFDPATQQWAVGVATTRYSANRVYGSNILLSLTPENNYDPRILILGGGAPATQTTELIDLGAPQPAWSYGPDMSAPRIEMNAVLLPNGKVLAMGGSVNDEDTSTASLTADIYDPVSNTMSSAGSNKFARLYHSVALLLPDATVWFAGGNPNDKYEKSMEIYQPPYLFTKVGTNVVPATRPTITSAPAHVDWGSGTFTVVTPDAADIAQVVIVRNGAVTHAFDMDQRLVGLSFTRGSGQLTVSGPPGGNIAPPGYYMLFLLNSAGVPSVSTQVQVGGSDFAITETPQSRLVLQGNSTTFNVAISSLVAFGDTAVFTVSGLPADATASFNPPSVTGAGSTVLTVNTLASTPPGSYTLGITATAGTLTHSVNATLNVLGPLPPGQLAMDITTSTDNNGGGTAISSPPFSTVTGNELLLAFISLDTPPSGGATVTGVTGGGLTWSLVKRQNAVAGDAEIWRAFAPNVLNNVTVTGTLSQSESSSITVVSFVGVDTTGTGGSGAIGAVGGTSATSGAPSASLVTTRNNSWVFGVGTDWDKALTHTVGPNQTMVHQALASVGSTYWVQGQTNPTPLSGTTVTINDTAPTTDKFDLAIVEIKSSVSTGPDFSLSSGPGSQGIQVGGNASYTTAVTGQGGFSGTVTLGVSGLPSGATGSFSPPTITASGTSTLNITTQPTTTPGTYPLTISGISGSLNHTVGVSLTIAGAPDFTIATTPASQSVIVGSSVTYTTTVTAQSGFSGVVTLNASSLPANTTGSFNPATITGSGTSTLTVTTTGTTPLGSDTFTVTGTSSSLSHATTNTIVVSALPPPNPLAVDVTTSADKNTSSTTAVSAPFSTTQSNELLLAFISCDSAPAGGMTVTGVTGGGLTWTLVKRANTQPGDAEIWRAFATTTLTNATVTATLAKSTASSITIMSFAGVDTTGTNGSGAIGASTSVSAATGAPTASLVTTRNNSWVFGVGTDYDRAVAHTPGPNQTMVHQLLSTVGSTYWVQQQNTSTALSGTTVTINDTAPTTDKFNLVIVEVLPPVTVSPDFTIAAVPATQTVNVGAGTSYTVTTTAVSGFTGTTDLSVGGLPNGATGTFTPASISGAGTSSLAITTAIGTTPPGTYSLTITGTSGSLTHTAGVMLVVTTPDFTIGGSPSSRTVVAGAGTNYTTTITAQNGFTDNVDLSISGLPAGAAATFTPTPVPGGGSSTLAVTTSTTTTPPGTYSLTVTGTSGLLVHTTGITLVVTGAPDFSIGAAPASRTVPIAGSTTYTASTTVQNGFAGQVALSVSGLPSGATGTFNPTTITGAGSATLTVLTDSTVAAGSWPFTITGTSGALTHTANATLVVTTAPPPAFAIDANVSVDKSTSSTTVTTTAFSTTAANELLLAFVSADSPSTGGQTVSSVTGAGLTWVLVKRANGVAGDAEIWRAFAPAVLSNVTVTATLARSSASSITVLSFTGVNTTGTNGSGAVGATGGASAASGAPTVSLVTTRNGSWVFAVGTDWDKATARTIGPNQTMVHQVLSSVGSTYWVQRQNTVTPLSGTTVTMNDTAPTADKFNLASVEVLPTP